MIVLVHLADLPSDAIELQHVVEPECLCTWEIGGGLGHKMYKCTSALLAGNAKVLHFFKITIFLLDDCCQQVHI